MKKITSFLSALLLTTVGAWAQSVKIQPSTDETTPEHVYLLVNGSDAFMDKGTGNVTDGEARGRFAFFAVDGKEGFYKIMSFDSDDANGKWLYYSDTGSAKNKVSFKSTQADAKEWKISTVISNGSAIGYQMQPVNEEGNAIATYMNWYQGLSGNTSVGFWTDGGSGDNGSRWNVVEAPVDGREYYLQDNCGVFLNLDILGTEPGQTESQLATLSTVPAKCKIKVTDSGAWKIYNSSDAYLGQSSGRVWNTWVDAGKSDFAWAVELMNVDGEYLYLLKNVSGTRNGYLGCDNHENGQALYVNQSDDAKKLKLKLVDGALTTVTVKVQNGEEAARKTVTLYLPSGEEVNLASYIPVSPLVRLEAKTITVDTQAMEETVGYEYNPDIPFAADYAGLGGDEDAENKWVSLFTKLGRMYVRDPQTADTKTKEMKNPAIDKATFTRLDDNHFWGFICTDPFAYPAIVKIVNKELTDGKTLYLCNGNNDSPLRFVDENGEVSSSWVTDEWIIETGKSPVEDGKTVQYYGIRANISNKRYINNNARKGFMTVWQDGPLNDDGSNMKFISEKNTYEILKERALNAPALAVHSLEAGVRQTIAASTASTVKEYKKLITDNVGEDRENGYVEFHEGAYYFIRNYTPANETAVYALGSVNGTTAATIGVTTPGTTEVAMTSSNANMIWKIEKNGDAPTDIPGVIGMSRTIPRLLQHVNSGKYLKNAKTRTLVNRDELITEVTPEQQDIDNYYFVDLGAGQHFMKNVQYTGQGNQAQAQPLNCSQDGALGLGALAHYKNTRDTWYVIEATSIDVTIGESGYATVYLPFGVTTSDLTAYAVTSVANGVATLTGGHSIPAGQGAILQGTPGTYKLRIDDSVNEDADVNAVFANNKLRGTNMQRNVEEAAYVLSMPEGRKVGLYKAAMNNGSWQNNNNKAYLPASEVGDANAPSLSFVFDGTETGINGIENAGQSDDVIYDLSGRRVKSARKGIFIINGKKVIK